MYKYIVIIYLLHLVPNFQYKLLLSNFVLDFNYCNNNFKKILYSFNYK